MKNYELTGVKALCPVCYSQKALLLYQVSSQEAAQHYVLNEANAKRFRALRLHIENLWRGNLCKVLRCANCAFSFAYPYVAGDSQFYTLAYQRTGYPIWKWEYEMTYRALGGLISQDRLMSPKLLEVGAGNGAFIKAVSPKLIPKSNILCTEYADYGLKEIEKYGVTCLPVDVRAIDGEKYKNHFDIICLFQILEHLDRLDSLFEQLSLLAKREAHLFIAVPNDRRIEFNEQHDAVLDMPPNHIGRWNRRCFEIISARHHWQVVDHKIEPERIVSIFKQFSIYRYLRRSQLPGTVYNKIETVRSRFWRRCLQLPMVGLHAIASLPLLRQINPNQLGDAQWIWLKKAEANQSGAEVIA